MSQIVVKRGGGDESFDTKKLYASIYTSMLAAKETVKTSEYAANEVSKYVHTWAQKYSEVTTKDIRIEAARKLQEFNTNAHFLYVHHKLLF